MDLVSDFISDQNEIELRFNMQYFIENVSLEVEVQEYKNKKKVKLTDIRREFINIDEPLNKKQFGKLNMDNKEKLDGRKC